MKPKIEKMCFYIIPPEIEARFHASATVDELKAMQDHVHLHAEERLLVEIGLEYGIGERERHIKEIAAGFEEVEPRLPRSIQHLHSDQLAEMKRRLIPEVMET